MTYKSIALFAFLFSFISCTRILERLGSISNLQVSPSIVFLHEAGDTAMVTVTADVAWTITMDVQAAQYFSVAPMQGTGNGQFVITALGSNADAAVKQGVISIHATDLPSVETKTITVTQQDNAQLPRNAFGGSGNDEFLRALPLPNGDFIVAGPCGGNNIGRLRRDGTFAWQKLIKHEYYQDRLVDMVPASDGQFLIAANDGILTKFDETGQVTWEKKTGMYEIEDVIKTPDGGFALAVTDKISNHDGWQLPFRDIDLRYYANSWIVKLDPDGNEIWKTPLAGTSKERSFEVNTIPGGDYIMCGYTESFDHDFADRPADKPVWVARFDAAGQKKSLQYFASNLEVVTPAITGTSDGGYLIANHIEPENQRHVRLSKVNANGNVDWEKTIEGMFSDFCYDVIEDSQGYYRVLVSGNNLDGIPLDNDKDGWIVTLNAAGSMLDLKGFGGFHRDLFNSITEISKGSFVIVGSTDSDDGDVFGYTMKIPGTRDRDAWIILY